MSMTAEKPDMMLGIGRGLLGKCPNCGGGRLFTGYLKVAPRCDGCGHSLGTYRADDGPAYFTVLLVGHLVIAPMLCFPFVWTANPIIVCAIYLPLLAAITLAALPRVKGAVIGGLWAASGGASQ